MVIIFSIICCVECNIGFHMFPRVRFNLNFLFIYILLLFLNLDLFMEINIFLHVYLGKPIFGWYQGCHNI